MTSRADFAEVTRLDALSAARMRGARLGLGLLLCSSLGGLAAALLLLVA